MFHRCLNSVVKFTRMLVISIQTISVNYTLSPLFLTPPRTKTLLTASHANSDLCPGNPIFSEKASLRLSLVSIFAQIWEPQNVCGASFSVSKYSFAVYRLSDSRYTYQWILSCFCNWGDRRRETGAQQIVTPWLDGATGGFTEHILGILSKWVVLWQSNKVNL